MIVYILIFFLAFWAGFSVRRASLCLVRATYEIIERKPLKTSLFVLEAMVVALSITIPAILLFPDKIILASTYNISWHLFLGAMVYGAGASINGSCALGTLNQLMNGKMSFIASIIGMALGFGIFLNVQHMADLQRFDTSILAQYRMFFLLPVMILVWAIVFFKVRKFWNTSEESKAKKLKQYISSSVARDFIGVAIFGFCSGVLFLILGGSWDYTYFIQSLERSIYLNGALDLSILPILVTTMALVSGISIASYLSNDFKLKIGNPVDFVVKIVAGALMGFSVGIIPGGNDSLILYSIPGIALHAPIALMFMMMSIAITIKIGDFFRKFSIAKKEK